MVDRILEFLKNKYFIGTVIAVFLGLLINSITLYAKEKANEDEFKRFQEINNSLANENSVNLDDVDKLPKEMMILDLEFKSESVSQYFNFLWNGPLGIFEIDLFSNGTKQLIDFLSQSDRKVIAGGGETIFAINKFSEKKNFHYVSTAGGAFLEYLSGKSLPSIEALELE